MSLSHVPSVAPMTKEHWQTLLKATFVKLNPLAMLRNPVMFVVEVGTVITFILMLQAHGAATRDYTAWVTGILFVTVLFSTFAEAYAEARGRAQADSLRHTQRSLRARKIAADGSESWVEASSLSKEDQIRVNVDEIIPGDGIVVLGVASIDESAITGESAPVIKGPGDSVTGGTLLRSDSLMIRIAANPGETFLDRMIGLIEGASRQKTPNEIALSGLLAVLTAIFLLVVVTLLPIASYYGPHAVSIVTLVALLVSLIPTTIGALLSAIGIAGMNRVAKLSVMAKSGRAVEAAGDVTTIILDKTGTLTVGNRMATAFIPAPGVSVEELSHISLVASLADTTPEGRSIVALAERQLHRQELPTVEGTAVPFSAETRMSGMNLADGQQIRKGALSAIKEVTHFPSALNKAADDAAALGQTPLAVAVNDRVLGLVILKDIVKPGLRERFTQLRAMGIKTVMATGDNPITAAAIAQEVGVDDYIAEVKPEDKLALIHHAQQDGQLIAMTGDGTNDAPALAQADVGLVMNAGTLAAKEAGNMIDMESNPTKLLDVIMVGKQLLITRGSLTTFSLANDVAKYFAIVPAMFVSVPLLSGLDHLNIMGLNSPHGAILSALIYNALIIPALIPFAMRGVAYKAESANRMLARNMLNWGLLGVVIPFAGIWGIDRILMIFGMG